MKQIEKSIALPVRQIVPSLQLAAGGAIVLAGAAVVLTRLLPLV